MLKKHFELRYFSLKYDFIEGKAVSLHNKKASLTAQ